LELEDIQVENSCPAIVRGIIINDFFMKLSLHDAEFEAMRSKLLEKNEKLRYMAVLENGKKPFD